MSSSEAMGRGVGFLAITRSGLPLVRGRSASSSCTRGTGRGPLLGLEVTAPIRVSASAAGSNRTAQDGHFTFFPGAIGLAERNCLPHSGHEKLTAMADSRGQSQGSGSGNGIQPLFTNHREMPTELRE